MFIQSTLPVKSRNFERALSVASKNVKDNNNFDLFKLSVKFNLKDTIKYYFKMMFGIKPATFEYSEKLSNKLSNLVQTAIATPSNPFYDQHHDIISVFLSHPKYIKRYITAKAKQYPVKNTTLKQQDEYIDKIAGRIVGHTQKHMAKYITMSSSPNAIYLWNSSGNYDYFIRKEIK